MQSIGQVRAALAARARTRDVALVGALVAATASLCVFSMLVIGNHPTPIRSAASTTAGGNLLVPPGSALPRIPAVGVRTPVDVPALALPDESQLDLSGGATSAAASGLAANGIPQVALTAYQHAAAVLAADRSGCHLDWSLLAAIGRVESNHGRFGGAVLTTSGLSRPPILGPVLDGVGFAVVRDTDNGTLDGNTEYDRAVGPFQFLPETWRAVGADGNNDGIADPFNIYDAAVGAGVYLCSGSADLADPAALHAAVFRYNHSDSYVALVLSLAQQYQSSAIVVLASGGVAVGGGAAGAGGVAVAAGPPAIGASTGPMTTGPTTSAGPTTTTGTSTSVAPIPPTGPVPTTEPTITETTEPPASSGSTCVSLLVVSIC